MNVAYKYLVSGQRFTELPPVTLASGISDVYTLGDIWTKQTDGSATKRIVTGFKDYQTVTQTFEPNTVVTLVNPN
jgi:hypothetical protein